MLQKSSALALQPNQVSSSALVAVPTKSHQSSLLVWGCTLSAGAIAAFVPMAGAQAITSDVAGLGGVSASLRITASVEADASVQRTLNLPAQPEVTTKVMLIPASSLLASASADTPLAFSGDSQAGSLATTVVPAPQLAVSIKNSSALPASEPIVNVVPLPAEPSTSFAPASPLSGSLPGASGALSSSLFESQPAQSPTVTGNVNFGLQSAPNLGGSLPEFRASGLESASSSFTGSSLAGSSDSALLTPPSLPTLGRSLTGTTSSRSLIASIPNYPRSPLAPEASVPVAVPAGQPFQPLPENSATSAQSSVVASELQIAAPIVKRVVFPQLPSLNLPELPGSDRYLPGENSSPTLRFIWPARGVFTSGFGPRWGRMHRGIDIAGPIGTPIMAAAAGVVITSEWNSGGFGNLVKVRHADGTVTLYAHNNRIMVRVGQEVQQGEQIAEMGSTGRSTGPHLHFEIHPAGGAAANPMLFLNQG